MAIAIKSIPTLKGNDAKSFVRAASKAESKRATIDYLSLIHISEPTRPY